jgi:hypothetical protein
MIPTLERRLIGAPKNTYKPANGFESLLGSQPIKIIDSIVIILEGSSRIKNLQILRLQDKIDSVNKDGLTRNIALLEDIDGHKAAIYFYQDNFDPKREKHSDNFSHNLFGEVATVGQVRVVSTTSQKNKDIDFLLEADSLARQEAVDSKMSGLKDNENIRISGSGTVIVTDMGINSFIAADSFQQAIGELFKPNGIFKNNLIVSSVNNKTLVANMERGGAQVLYKTANFPNLVGLLLDITSEAKLDIPQKILRSFYDRLMPLIVYVPYFEKLYEDKEVQMGYRDITEYMRKQLLPLIERIRNGLERV